MGVMNLSEQSEGALPYRVRRDKVGEHYTYFYFLLYQYTYLEIFY